MLMNAAYGSIWMNQFEDEHVADMIKRLWFYHLKHYEELDIRRAMTEVAKLFNMPPKINEFLEVVKKVKRIREDRLNFKQQDEARLLPKPERKPSSRETLEAKVKMFESIGMHAKAETYANEIRHMDM